MLTQAQLSEFEKNGFLKGSVVLNDDEVEQLREELALVMEGKTVKKPVLSHNMLEGGSLYDDMKMTVTERVVQIVNIWMASDKYFQHAAHPVITEEIAQLCNTDTLRIWHDQIQYKPPISGGPTGWHQDHPLWPIIQPADLVSAWVALDDAVIENGCMWMVPGSHKWGDQQKHLASTPDFKPYHKNPELLPEGAVVEAVPFEIKKGQVGYHHSLTWHGSPHNRSELHRRAIAVHYMPGHTRYQPSANHPMHQFVTVNAGDLMSGSHFPVVYSKED
ncbi:phytanoyl-CoA dioxygenase family protein [Paenibacillus mendelii]|uniref:Phytanoyl-CoA dioxygenase family protein n=1 Tax=Paenibacillus mendelii TaxID=206163 RepID=A0ABV6J9H4_9BACL|nr:phytanoyl-CoA dioxygenase family protein [Paenibacillus mendelii]MCQ6559468.1 phytanoyl-CoA dioxygenase family protein [Paenibacillus mendelii]